MALPFLSVHGARKLSFQSMLYGILHFPKTYMIQFSHFCVPNSELASHSTAYLQVAQERDSSFLLEHR